MAHVKYNIPLGAALGSTPGNIQGGNALLVAVATDIVTRATAPNLNHIQVILPSLNVAPLFRRTLLNIAASQRQWTGILGPQLTTLPELARCHSTDQACLAANEKSLALFDVIRHASVFDHGDPWAITEQLLVLFDELEAHNAHIHINTSEDQFTEWLTAAYQITETEPLEALAAEANIVFQLWQGWRQYHQERAVLSSIEAYVASLSHAVTTTRSTTEWHCVSPALLTKAEQSFLGSLSVQADVYEWHYALHAEQYHSPPTGVHQLLATIFTNPHTPQPPLLQRATHIASSHSVSPFVDVIDIAAAQSTEHEALMASLQIRQWWLQGERNIGIVGLDRRLTRRVRALLDRANISVRDYGGWALSTTSAATVLDRLLQTVELQFAHEPLLDLLKSPFIRLLSDQDEALFKRSVYRFERDIVRFENITQGLHRYLRQTERRSERLDGQYDIGQHITRMLEELGSATRELQQSRQRTWPQQASQLLATLITSLEQLNVTPLLQEDLAGKKLLDTLTLLQLATEAEDIALTWSEFRTWLGRTLESTDFMPPFEHEHVALLSLEQSNLWHFDRLLIIGANMGNLPAAVSVTPFFNEHVRVSLGLPTLTQHIHIQQQRFLQCLLAADRVTITYTAHGDDGAMLISPWLELFEQFHQIAWQRSLMNVNLAAQAWEAAHDVVNRELPPATVDVQPAPVLSLHKLPNDLSASAHNMLISCPYQYFLSRALHLRAPEEVQELLSNADYGSIVHRILELFHRCPDRGWTDAITESSAAAATQRLISLSQAEFLRDVERNILHQSWLQRWLDLASDYIQWQVEHEMEWQPDVFEQEGSHPLSHFRLTGSIDRIDHAPGDKQSRIVIDYKTGSTTPSDADIDNGEANQLSHYAVLAPNVSAVQYLLLNRQRGGARATNQRSGDELNTLREAMLARLQTLEQQLSSGTQGLPAWQNKQCQHCRLAGICRVKTWNSPDD